MLDEVILDAAEDCFAMVGVRGTTIDDIATAAGVTRVTVYRRIGNRDRLVLQVLVRITERHLARLRPRLVAQPDLVSALALLVRATVGAARRDDLRLLFASEERGATGAPIPGAFGPLSRCFGQVVTLLAERFPDQLDPSVEAVDVGGWLLRIVVSLATIELEPGGSETDADRWVRRFAMPGLVVPAFALDDTK